MAKKGTSGLADKLSEQMEARLRGVNSNPETDLSVETGLNDEPKDNDSVDTEFKKPGRPTKNKKQKTFYIPEELIHLLRRHKFEKYKEESTTVCEALEQYFKKEGYIE